MKLILKCGSATLVVEDATDEAAERIAGLVCPRALKVGDDLPDDFLPMDFKGIDDPEVAAAAEKIGNRGHSMGGSNAAGRTASEELARDKKGGTMTKMEKPEAVPPAPPAMKPWPAHKTLGPKG